MSTTKNTAGETLLLPRYRAAEAGEKRRGGALPDNICVANIGRGGTMAKAAPAAWSFNRSTP
jgi:hypothetical protein